MMAKGEELKFLFANPNHALELWTSKEAVQKAARLGMNLNPREIKIPIGNKITNISIGNSNFKLDISSLNDFKISVAICQGEGYDAIPEDELLSQTLMAMNEDPNWSIGCKTTRSNA